MDTGDHVAQDLRARDIDGREAPLECPLCEEIEAFTVSESPPS